jgi:uncharacterized membrane protein
MTFWGLSVLDAIGLAYFLTCWIGCSPFLRWWSGRQQIVGTVMIDHRRAWMDELLGRDVKVADTAIVGHIMSTAGFFASTTVIVIAALLGVLVNTARGLQSGTNVWITIAPPGPFEIKLVLILVIAVYAFLSFTWAIRQANYAAVMMGAAPPSKMNPILRKRLAAAMGNIITGVAESYDNGMRSYYFALGTLTWIVSPLLFIATTSGVLVILLYRQSKSSTALALREISAAHLEAAQADEGPKQ